jgi:hypothetical protein
VSECVTCGQTTFSCSGAGEPAPSCPVHTCIELDCTGLDEATCSRTAGCTVGMCPGICGGPATVSCYRAGVDAAPQCPGPVPCPQPAEPCDLLDEAACAQRPECTSVPCPDCMGGLSFGGCAGPGEEITCTPCPLPLGCSLFGEMLCAAVSSCQPVYCPDCMGGRKFVGCDQLGASATCADGCPSSDGGIGGSNEVGGTTGTAGTGGTCGSGGALCMTSLDCCTGFYCYVANGQNTGLCGPPPFSPPPPQPPCSSVATERECVARPDCHVMFEPSLVCNRTYGCLPNFSWCADGANAACNGPTGMGGVSCSAAPPLCDGAFVTSYTVDCYEGCVLPSECGP